jgi:DNA-directed RNA polymerase subunit M/transcription elongation factor TFIIS
VVECSNCKRFLLATSDKRTRTCAYCGKRMAIEDARIVARSEKAGEARLVLQELKIQERGAKLSDSNSER